MLTTCMRWHVFLLRSLLVPDANWVTKIEL